MRSGLNMKYVRLKLKVRRGEDGRWKWGNERLEEHTRQLNGQPSAQLHAPMCTAPGLCTWGALITAGHCMRTQGPPSPA